MPYLSEADTRSKLIDPAIYKRGWTEAHIRREETAGSITVRNGRAQRGRGRIDYVLRVIATHGTQPVAVALIEAKAESLPPDQGLEQAKKYARTLNVPFVFSSNGHLFVEYDAGNGLTSAKRPLAEFPSPEDLQQRYEAAHGFKLADKRAAPLLAPYKGGEGNRRYYQDAAIRAVLEKIAAGGNRALLSLATGAGKTYIAVNLLRRIADAGQLKRALFLCDRDELRQQALGALQGGFGADAAAVTGSDAAKNAKVLIATYQTLGIDSETGDASFLTTHYPADFFSHIVIDECHRSAWGKWSEVLKRNPNAVHIGLTATPRHLEGEPNSAEARADLQITADNYRWFGEPVYEYDMAQAIEDGYLAACEIRTFDLFHDNKAQNERETGVDRADLRGKTVTDARTGEILTIAELKDHYGAPQLDDILKIPERVQKMCESLFCQLLETGGPHQKTIVFCTRDEHADQVAAQLNNLYSAWCVDNEQRPTDPYAFKCTAAAGSDQVAELRGASRRSFIACTVDLLSTGVDVPCVRNIVFFRYLKSPITFYQMVGRGTRIDAPSGKLMFRLYDYTNVSRLFGEGFRSRYIKQAEDPEIEKPEPGRLERVFEVDGIEVHVTDAGHYILAEMDGKAMPITVEEYKQRLAARLVAGAPTLDAFRQAWVRPEDRRALLALLPEAGRSAYLIRQIDEMSDYDLYDVLAALGYGMAPRSRLERSGAFTWKQEGWLKTLPGKAPAVVKAIADQFARGGTESLENPALLNMPAVVRAGGLAALKHAVSSPAALIEETKQRIFAA